MKKNLVETGIDVLGSVPWGTHFCQAFQSTEDLLEVLVPYFSKGLESNNYCLWISHSPEEKEEVRKALEKNLGSITGYENSGQLEFLSNRDYYYQEGIFDRKSVLNRIHQLADLRCIALVVLVV